MGPAARVRRVVVVDAAGASLEPAGEPVLTFTMGDDVALDGTTGGQHAQLALGAAREAIRIDHPSRDAFYRTFFNTAAFVPTNRVPRGVYGSKQHRSFAAERFRLPRAAAAPVPHGVVQRIQPDELLKPDHRRQLVDIRAHPRAALSDRGRRQRRLRRRGLRMGLRLRFARG